MSLATVADIIKGSVPVGEIATVNGWVRTRRDSKAGISFLAIYDGSCFDPVQAVIENTLENYNDDVLSLTAGCSVRVTGKVVESMGKGQSFELQATKVEVYGFVDEPDTYPMAAKRHSIEYLREIAHLRPRTNIIGAVARVRNTLSQAVHRFYHEQGYLWISTPILTASDCEGAGEMFRVSTLDMDHAVLLRGRDHGRGAQDQGQRAERAGPAHAVHLPGLLGRLPERHRPATTGGVLEQDVPGPGGRGARTTDLPGGVDGELAAQHRLPHAGRGARFLSRTRPRTAG